jgi:hypothetical protein
MYFYESDHIAEAFPYSEAISTIKNNFIFLAFNDRLCGLVIRVPGYRSRGPGFPALPDFLRSSGSETGPTQPRENK